MRTLSSELNRMLNKVTESYSGNVKVSKEELQRLKKIGIKGSEEAYNFDQLAKLSDDFSKEANFYSADVKNMIDYLTDKGINFSATYK